MSKRRKRLPARGLPTVVRVIVSEQDMRDGERRCCRSCPIALALSRSIGEPAEVLDGAAHLVNHSATYILPRSAKAYIRRFDEGRTRYDAPRWFVARLF